MTTYRIDGFKFNRANIAGLSATERAAIRTLRPDLRAIMAGDADAVDRLASKIASAERSQQAMKDANKAIRTHAKAGEAHQVTALMELGFNEAQAVKLLHPQFSYQGQGFPGYSLSNNNANIRRMAERLAQIEAAQACEVVQTEGADGVTLEDDAPANRVRLFFPGKPSEEIRSTLKSAGFRWAPSLGAWQAYRNNGTLKTARDMAGTPCEAVPSICPEENQEGSGGSPVQNSNEQAAPTPPAVESQPVALTVETADTLAKFTDDGDGVSGELVDLIEVATKDQVQALTDSQFQTLYDHLENWNFHTENYMLEALRLDDDSIITEMQAIATTQQKDGCLHIDIYERRNIIARRMRDLKQSKTEKQAQVMPSVAQVEESGAWTKERCELSLSAQQRPTVNSKSGRWCAWLYINGLGLYGLKFEDTSGSNGVSSYATASDRMKALQALARAADAPDDTPPGKPTHEKPNAVQASPAQAQADQTPEAGAIDAPGTATAGTDAGICAVETAGVGVEGCAHSKTESVPAFEQVKPFSLDLRALLSEGMKPADFIGYGVVYTGDLCNPDGTGAIVSAELCTWAGLRLSVILEDGRTMNATASNFGDKSGDRFRLDWKRHGTPYMAQLSASATLKRLGISSAAEMAKNARAKALIDLPAQYPQLKRAENTCTGGKLAAANIRILLKAAFKGVKFSVTSDYSKVSVSWADGPAASQVEAITDKFDIGASDTQTDYFYTVSTAFSDLFGGVQYMSLRRNESDALLQKAIDQVYHDRAIKPTVSDYHKREGVFSWDGSNFENRRMREALNTTSKA